MKKCKFNRHLKCRYKNCINCQERRKIGQKILIAEKPSITFTENIDLTVTCPYCLYTDRISKFTIKLKSGKVSDKRFQCPDCKEIMHKNTLTAKMTIEEYAKWVAALGKNFWSRVQFDKFKQRLKELGISREFWEIYKKTKKELETYEEYLERKQREEWVDSGNNGYN
jgi:transposase-like protein